jgi:uncharacterized protein with PQ loop repeat
MPDGLHHLHKRKRIHQLDQPYPHPDRLINTLDRLVFFVALLSVVMTVPQLLQIWLTRSAAGVSLVSWATYTFGAFFWMLYGVVHKERLIIAIYAIYTVVNALIVAGILLYG